jgi:hypothetical protein
MHGSAHGRNSNKVAAAAAMTSPASHVGEAGLSLMSHCCPLLPRVLQNNCSVRVTVLTVSSRTAVNGAVVSGSWRSVVGRTGWPYAVSATTASTGVATLTSNPLPATQGNGCSFAVADVKLSGYILAPSALKVSPNVTW